MTQLKVARKLRKGVTGDWGLGTGDWVLGTGYWGLGTGDWERDRNIIINLHLTPIPNFQSPVPNHQSLITSPQSLIPNPQSLFKLMWQLCH
ncbi:hypothetical protein JYQ62_14405 [Nostoc sp. UHCC 0702]|nr:hypothetical protein JYQ62_14405 [Nostoc sp. UHCC 0702]